MRKTNAEGVELIKRNEGLRLEAYLCPASILTIGYGHTGDVSQGQKITAHQAEAILAHDLERFESSVSSLVPASVTDNQFSALVSFAFNEGTQALAGSTLLRKLRDGYEHSAADEFLRWNKAHVGGELKVLPGLTKRRAEERALFLKR